MINALMYRLRCDVCRREAPGFDNNNRFELQRKAEAAGWRFRRRKDGNIARSGGKDYCPLCVADNLT